jgi:rubrerythrin
MRSHNEIVYPRRRNSMTDENSNEQDGSVNQGEAVPLNWACTNCGYHVEGELPEKCPECGESREMFEEVPIPGY